MALLFVFIFYYHQIILGRQNKPDDLNDPEVSIYKYGQFSNKVWTDSDKEVLRLVQDLGLQTSLDDSNRKLKIRCIRTLLGE